MPVSILNRRRFAGNKTGKITKTERRNLFLGLAFISPWIIGFLLLTVYPLAASLYYSFTRYDLLRPEIFIGLDNYKEIFTRDVQFVQVFGNTLFYVGLGAPIIVAAAFLLAFLLNKKIRARSVFRAIFFFPTIVPAVVVAMIWAFLLNTQYGAINGTLQALGQPVIRFLSTPDLAKPSLIMINVWACGTSMVIFLAALQSVPRDFYEAATMDGANGWHKFWFITIPMTSPVILYNLIITFIWGFQDFTLPMLLTGGGPNESTLMYSMYLYNNAFIYLRMGKASALAWILFIIILLFTWALFRSSRKWVFYNDGKE